MDFGRSIDRSMAVTLTADQSSVSDPTPGGVVVTVVVAVSERVLLNFLQSCVCACVQYLELHVYTCIHSDAYALSLSRVRHLLFFVLSSDRNEGYGMHTSFRCRRSRFFLHARNQYTIISILSIRVFVPDHSPRRFT